MNLHAFLLGQSTEPTLDTRRIYQDLIEDAQLCEELGFEAAWFAEHHFSNYAIVPNSLTLLAAMARETHRIRLGTSIILLPLRNPIFVAEETAMVDQLSKGRLEVGFGRGYQPYEFKRLGVDFAKATDLLVEGLDAFTHLFTNPDVPFKSTMFDIPAMTIAPTCWQLPHPPVWLACGSPESMGAALDRGMSIVANIGNSGPALAEKMVQMYRAECARRGIDPSSRRFALQTHGCLIESKDDEDAVVRSGGFLHRVQVRLREQRERIVLGINDASGTERGEPNFAGWSSASLIGTREHIARQMARFAGFGLSDLFVTFRFGELGSSITAKSLQAIAEAARETGTRAKEAA